MLTTVIKTKHNAMIGSGRNTWPQIFGSCCQSFHCLSSCSRAEWLQRRWESHLKRNPHLLNNNNDQNGSIANKSVEGSLTSGSMQVERKPHTNGVRKKSNVKLIKSRAIDIEEPVAVAVEPEKPRVVRNYYLDVLCYPIYQDSLCNRLSNHSLSE